VLNQFSLLSVLNPIRSIENPDFDIDCVKWFQFQEFCGSSC
jgi:hypothetical protein